MWQGTIHGPFLSLDPSLCWILRIKNTWQTQLSDRWMPMLCCWQCCLKQFCFFILRRYSNSMHASGSNHSTGVDIDQTLKCWSASPKTQQIKIIHYGRVKNLCFITWKIDDPKKMKWTHDLIHTEYAKKNRWSYDLKHSFKMVCR